MLLLLSAVMTPLPADASASARVRIEAIQALEDPAGTLRAPGVADAPGWKRLDSGTLSRGYTRSVWWLKLDLAFDMPMTAVIAVAPSYLDDVRFFLAPDEAQPSHDPGAGVVEASRQGDTAPVANRDRPSRKFNLAITAREASSRTVYLRIRSTSSMVVMPEITSEAEFDRRDRLEDLIAGMVGGIVIAMLVLAALLFRRTRDPLYGHYTLAAATYGAYMSCVNGYGTLLFFTNGEPGSTVTNAVILASIGSSALLARQLLEVARFSRLASHLLLVTAGVEFACAGLTLLGHYQTLGPYAVPIGAVLPILNLPLLLVARSRGLGLSTLTEAGFVLVPLGHLPLLGGLFGLYAMPPWAFYLGQLIGIVYLMLLIPELLARDKGRQGLLARAESDAEFALRTIAQQRDLQRLQAEWISMITHEIKTPLSVIDSCRQSLERMRPDPEVTSRLARIRKAVERIDTLVHQLLSQRDRAARHAGIRGSTIPLAPWIRSIVDAAVGDAADRVRIEVPEEMDAWVDSDLLGIALNNLLHNALRHGDLGAPILVDARQEGGILEIGVESGVEPIPPALRGSLFARTPGTGGARSFGIGLWACRTIAQAHGGDARLKPLAAGNRFLLQLPQPVGRKTPTGGTPA